MKNPRTYSDVVVAANDHKPHIRYMPVVMSRILDELVRASVYLKREIMQSVLVLQDPTTH